MFDDEVKHCEIPYIRCNCSRLCFNNLCLNNDSLITCIEVKNFYHLVTKVNLYIDFVKFVCNSPYVSVLVVVSVFYQTVVVRFSCHYFIKKDCRSDNST